VPVNVTSEPVEFDVVVVRKRVQRRVDLGIAELVLAPDCVRLGEICSAARCIEDEVRDDLVSLDSGHVMRRVDPRQEVLDGRVVGFRVLGQDGETYAEEIGLDGEVVDTLGSDDALA